MAFRDLLSLVSQAPSKPAMGVLARIEPWVQAARPLAFPMIFIPLLMGQAFAFDAHGQFSGMSLLYTALFGVLFQVYLLYTNDHADEAIDKTNKQHWLSGGSRVLPEGKLRSADLLVGSRIAFALMLGLTFYLVVDHNRPWLPVGMALAVVLCWAYNRHPLRLSYRGHGEVLQGLGCGVLLPLIGFFMQTGSLQQFPWSALVSLFLVFYAGNIITALPDYRSDRAGGKHTYPVRYGELTARASALLLLAVAYISSVFAFPTTSPSRLAIVVIPACLVLIAIAGSGVLRNADVAEFSVCKSFVNWTSASQAWFLCAWIGVLFVGSSL
ncbi:MAG: prenyltransferase [Pseudomonadota bacterium]